MTKVDKNKAMLTYLTTCPVVKDNPTYFNFADETDNDTQFITETNEGKMTTPFIDGSIRKNFTFRLILFRSVTSNELVDEGENNENVEDFAELQEIIDWLEEQEDSHIYPDFGDKIEIDRMTTLSDVPVFEGINSGVSPALAMYSIAIRIDYIDYSKTIWS